MGKGGNLYKTLGVAQDADHAAVCKAYRKLALRYHPDRNPDGADAFKAVSAAYEVLGDADARRAYDVTGRMPGSNGEDDPELSEAERFDNMGREIRAFYATYRGSEEERADLVTAFATSKGGFKTLVTAYALVDHTFEGEVRRLFAVVSALLEEGRIDAPPKVAERWARSTADDMLAKLERRVVSEKAEAEEMLAAMGAEARAPAAAAAGDAGPLMAIRERAQQRAQEHASLTDDLFAKYCKPRKGKPAPVLYDLPDDFVVGGTPRRKKTRTEKQ
jgi:DnaJ family protein C protein 9